jgi:predicted DCC family thiol-disulfide oxidoreductase YuxK
MARAGRERDPFTFPALMAIPDRPLLVLYDRDCGFCRVCLAVLLSWDRRRRFAPLALQDGRAAELLPGLDDDARMRSWHVVAGGTVRSAGAAFAPALRELPGGAPLALVARHAERPLDSGYRWVAEHRTALGRFVPGAARAWANGVIARRG